MKKALETAFFLAALALGAYAVRQILAPRKLAVRPSVANPASAPGEDVENPRAAAVRPPRGVRGLPMVNLSPAQSPVTAPPPAASAP